MEQEKSSENQISLRTEVVNDGDAIWIVGSDTEELANLVYRITQNLQSDAFSTGKGHMESILAGQEQRPQGAYAVSLSNKGGVPAVLVDTRNARGSQVSREAIKQAVEQALFNK